MKPAEEQLAHITKNVEVALPEGALVALLEEDRPLRVKLGIDPTAPEVTLGWAVVFDLLRRFQEMGHTAVLIVGDFTAQVGDPSEAAGTRKRLSAEEVRGYADNLLPMVEELLLTENLEIRYNSEWLGALDMHDVLELTSNFTVAQIMDRDDFSKRWDAAEPISMIEFMYPLLQGMDSVAVEADVEIGGTDQLWNLLVGRDLQERRGQAGQSVVTVPLLIGTDGVKKMSQSIGNYISVRDPGDDMFGKVMSIPDEVMPGWYQLAAGADRSEVEGIEAALGDGSLHPGEAKRELGRRIVATYWGEEAAAAAEAAFDKLFRAKEIPDDVPEHPIPDEARREDGTVSLPVYLEAANLVSSRSEARRLIADGAVKINGEKVDTEFVDLDPSSGTTVQVGKRRFARVVP
jgi:tyrosyl-tRNA synthetase